MKINKKSAVSLATLGVTLLINALGATGLINGMTQKDVSDNYSTLITPAPFAFAIWGAIYVLLLIGLVYLTFAKSEYAKVVDKKISNLFWLSCLINSLWIIAFSYQLILLSMLLIVGLMLVIALINQRLLEASTKKAYLLPVAFGLYGGWLVMATMVNIAAWLVRIKFDGFGWPIIVWPVITLIVATAVISFIIYKNRNPVYSLPVIWAMIGIYQVKYPMYYNLDLGKEVWLSIDDNALLKTTLIAMIVVIVINSGYLFYKNNYQILPFSKSKLKTKKLKSVKNG